tara:strand:+ start:37 stop:1047 length:1011 start_codon:yes stop_codon:yes gene_type:complete
MAKDVPESVLKTVFTDIVRGYSAVYDEEFGKIYVKHLNSFDSSDIEGAKEKYYNKAKKMGVPTEAEQEQLLLEQGLWSEKKERRISEQKIFVNNLIRQKRKLYLKSQIEKLKVHIDESEKKLEEMEIDKIHLMGQTCERFANKKVNEYYMYVSVFKDDELEDRKFTSTQFDELTDDQLSSLINIYNNSTAKFDSSVIKRVALSPLFLNFFYLCDDNAVNFYGKPIIELTFYQTEVFSHGLQFKNILSDTKNKPPDDIANDPDKLIEWAEANKNAQEVLDKSEDKGEGSASSLVGATPEDLKHLGIDMNTEGISLEKAAADKGGSLNMQDLMKLHGV